MQRLKLLAFMMILIGPSCVDKMKLKKADNPLLLTTEGRYERSNTAGNLVASALVEHYKLDMAFYPSSLLASDSFAIVETAMSAAEIQERILPLYPNGAQDLFQIGAMRGSNIRKFLSQRTTENYRVDLQVAGVEYDMRYEGGLQESTHIQLPRGQALDDDRYYRVAISDYYYFNPATFPGYRFRNGLESGFERESGLYSAREALVNYLSERSSIPPLDEPRAQIQQRQRGEISTPLSIPEIQGVAHLSPYYGYKVQTKGVITAIAKKDQGTTELYLQSLEDDGDPRTSNAISVYLSDNLNDLQVGMLLEITGWIYEIHTAQGLTRTAIREVTQVRILAHDQVLPAPVLVGGNGLRVPSKKISSYRGNVNQEPCLNLEDGLGFWESLEGMRIKLARPRVVGFRGGQEKYADTKQYMAINVTPGGVHGPEDLNAVGGLNYDTRDDGDLNPEIIRIPLADLAPQVKADQIFNIGDSFASDLEGILSFETNTFGDGEFVFYVTGEFSSTSSMKSLEERPKTRLLADNDHVTVATFNVENLSADQTERMKRIGDVIRINLKCPDVINLPEIQDNNGAEFGAGAAAEKTLKALIDSLRCPGARYEALNIDPVPNQDGGMPGGNIRVAMIYNAQRIQFDRRGYAGPLDETLIDAQGVTLQNPGRVFPNDSAFQNSRKSMVAEFFFKGQPFYVIGNHTNSKLGDRSPWSAMQPVTSSSEKARIKITSRIQKFVSLLLTGNPQANILVVGDFNAYHYEQSMQVLAGSHLKNLMTYESLVSPKDWFSTNYDGNSAAIDFIFASHSMLERNAELEIVHVNSPYMGRISDHDPVVSRFQF